MRADATSSFAEALDPSIVPNNAVQKRGMYRFMIDRSFAVGSDRHHRKLQHPCRTIREAPGQAEVGFTVGLECEFSV
jgi:hypothetical protein